MVTQVNERMAGGRGGGLIVLIDALRVGYSRNQIFTQLFTGEGDGVDRIRFVRVAEP